MIMDFIKRNLYKAVVLAYMIFTPFSLIYAAQDPSCKEGQICNPLSGSSTIQEFIQKVLEGALKIGMPIIALAIIYCGFLFVSARGNPESLTKAKSALLYTLIGAAILLGSWAIAKLISETVRSLG